MRTVGAIAVLVLAAGAVVMLLGGGGSTAPGGPRVSAAPGAPGAPGSPVEGVVVGIDSAGLTRVTGFRLRAMDGTETAFTIGILENGVEFPPGHLAEHMATSTRVRVFYRDEGGTPVVYRIEDAE